jgi:hypothetical protein
MRNQRKLNSGTKLGKGTKVMAASPTMKVDQPTTAKKDGRVTSADKEGRQNQEVSLSLKGRPTGWEKDAARSSLRNTSVVSEEVMEALTRGGGRTIRRRMVMDAIITES